jgi:hypothetical protein
LGGGCAGDSSARKGSNSCGITDNSRDVTYGINEKIVRFHNNKKYAMRK